MVLEVVTVEIPDSAVGTLALAVSEHVALTASSTLVVLPE